MPDRVVSEKQLTERLKSLGYSQTTETTATGTYWRSSGGRHLEVPFSIQGFYPDWMLIDLEEKIGKLNPWPFIGWRYLGWNLLGQLLMHGCGDAMPQGDYHKDVGRYRAHFGGTGATGATG